MQRQPWLIDELGLRGCALQAAALWRRSLARPWLTSLLGVGCALGIFALVAFGRRTYTPTFVLRVVEGHHTPGSTQPLKRQLAEYVRQAVFTSQPLIDIMRREGLYPSLLRKNERAALESFREDITVDVYQNYFVGNRAGNAPRTARLSVGYRSKDPAQALAVTRALGGLIVERERLARRDQAQSAAWRAEHARDALVSAYQHRSADVMATQSALTEGNKPDPRRQVELVSLLGSLGSLERQVDAAEKRSNTLELGATLERHGIGLSFQVVDDGSLPGYAQRMRAAVWAGLATLIFGLPLLALGVGAFVNKRGAT